MAQTLGESVGETVGLVVRFATKVSRDTRIEVVTRRVATTGRTYNKRLVDCGTWRIKTLGEGPTLRDMEKPRPYEVTTKLAPKTPPTYVSFQSCKLAGLV